MAKLDWDGEAIVAKHVTAARLAVDRTTGAAVSHAKQNHDWANITGTLEGSLRMEPAAVQGDDVVGRWGSFDTAYALWLEIGTANMTARPYLRPAAGAEYPGLAGRLLANLAAMA